MKPPKGDDKDKGKVKKKEENFPGPGAYNILGENKKPEESKPETKKKEDKNKQPLENATYITDTLAHGALAPGPGN